jgi:hypothetical protein
MKNQLLEKKSELRAAPTAYTLQIEDFKHLVERDNTQNKEVAQKELAYIYHCVDPLSSYSKYEDDVRKEQVKEDIFGTDTDWVEDAYVRQAMETYRELNMTEAQKLLKSAKKSAKSLRKYFEEVDLTEEDDRGKLKWSAKDLINNLGKLGTVIEGIKDLEDQVEKEMMDQGQLRGGVKTTKYNE